MNIGRDIAAAYSSWTAHLGLITSAFGILSYLAKALAVSLSAPMQQVIETFRDIFHTPITRVASFFDFYPTTTEIDLALIWLFVGGAVGATIGVLLRNRSPDPKPYFVTTPEGAFLNFFAGSWLGRALLIALSALIWPILVLMGVRYPSVVRSNPHQAISLFNWDILESWKDAPGEIRVICDLRAVLVVQLLALFAGVLALLIGNMLAH